MTDDMDKLAANMRDLKPSKKARKSGMDAAMAAFDAEFASVGENLTDAQTVNEKKSETSQGLAAAARPTGQSADIGSVQTLGTNLMAKFNQLFNFTPRAAMMGGSCMAALLAALVIMPNFDYGTNPMSPGGSAIVTDTGEPVADTTARIDVAQAETTPAAKIPDEIIVTGSPRVNDNAFATEPAKIPTPATERPEAIQFGNDAPPPPQIVISSSPSQPEQQKKLSPLGELLEPAVSEHAPNYMDERGNAETDALKRGYEAILNMKDKLSLHLPQETKLTQNAPSKEASLPNTTPLPGGYTLEEVPAEYKTETRTIVTKEATTEILQASPVYETVTETVVVQPSTTEIVVTAPAEYEWVDGDIEGGTVEYETAPVVYETVSEAVVVQEASTELVTIPPVYRPDGSVAKPAQTIERVIPSVTKMETRRVVKTPASTVERVVPYEKRNGQTRVPVKPATVTERVVPAVTKQVTRRIIKTPASVTERIVPAGTKKEATVITEVSPERFYLRDDSGKIVREFESRDAFEEYTRNAVTSVQDKPVSTFSIDVDTASYSFLRASLKRGQLPPPSAIRLEEMINYFSYDYDAPKSSNEPFKANVTVTPTPWNADTKLMHIGIKGYVPSVSERPRSNLVFLIDTSGSMGRANKLPLLIKSFNVMLDTLDHDDTVSIVTYAGSAGTVLEPTSASDKDVIRTALNRLHAGGSTAGAAGLELAYLKAQENFDDEGVNRVILATDGDFNVGFSSPDDMKRFVEKKRETGVYLSVLGFGMGNYNDHLMQSLAQNGNGVAAYIDSLSEAKKVLANEAGSALFTIAKDVKIQVEFNPETISEYRLIGYETRALKREDFNNDKVDAGEIGAGHTVTAIYEMTPVGSPAQLNDDLRYAKNAPKTTGSDEFAFVKIRHKLPSADKSTLQTFPVGPRLERKLKRAKKDMRFATAVAAFGQKLRGDTPVADYSYDDIVALATKAKGKDKKGYRAEFIELVRLAESLDD